jgi:hypothetical protein
VADLLCLEDRWQCPSLTLDGPAPCSSGRIAPSLALGAAKEQAQRELTEYYQDNLCRELRRLADPGVDDALVRDMVAYMSIVLDGIAGHRLMFEDPQRMARVWPLVVDTVVGELSPRRGGVGRSDRSTAE